MTTLFWTIGQFLICAALIFYAGSHLSRLGDTIADRSGLGGTFIGVLAMAAVTSLPELITGASSVVLFDVADIAAGDVIGSCMFNLLILAMLDLRHAEPLTTRIHQGHTLVAGFGIVQLGAAGLAIVAGARSPSFGWVGLSSLVFLGSYLVAMRMIYAFEQARMPDALEQVKDTLAQRLRRLHREIALFGFHALLLVGAAVYLPGIADRLAKVAGLEQSFVGTFFVAIATSLPEVVVTIAAARLGALDMAAGNLLGSNVINIAILGFDDLLYTKGPILRDLAADHLIGVLGAITMTATAIIGLTYRAQRKRFRMAWDSLAMVAVYVAAIVLVMLR